MMVFFLCVLSLISLAMAGSGLEARNPGGYAVAALSGLFAILAVVVYVS